jgi:hypothetical protein
VTITQTLDASRAALRGEPEPLVLQRAGGKPVVAFLVTLGPIAFDQVVVPLVSGANLIGRNKRWPKPLAVESGQWVITCDDGRATIRDAASTNESAFVPRSTAQVLDHEGEPWTYARDALPSELARARDLKALRSGRAPARPAPVATFPRYAPLLKVPGVVLLPHANEPGGDALHPLDEGDVVCSCYAAFAFGWTRARPS